MSEYFNESGNRRRIISYKGLIFSLLTTLGILVVQEIVAKFTGDRWLDTYFFIGWALFPMISTIAYCKFMTTYENFISIIIIVILNFMLRYIFYYFTDTMYNAVDQNIGFMQSMNEITIYDYMRSIFYDGLIEIRSVKLDKEGLLLFNIMGLAFNLYFTRRELYKAIYKKCVRVEDVIGYISDNMQQK